MRSKHGTQGLVFSNQPARSVDAKPKETRVPVFIKLLGSSVQKTVKLDDEQEANTVSLKFTVLGV